MALAVGKLLGYTGRRSAGWCHPVGLCAALQWLEEIPPASFAGSPRAVHSRNHDRQTPYSAEKKKKKHPLKNSGKPCSSILFNICST